MKFYQQHTALYRHVCRQLGIMPVRQHHPQASDLSFTHMKLRHVLSCRLVPAGHRKVFTQHQCMWLIMTYDSDYTLLVTQQFTHIIEWALENAHSQLLA